jgi:hypothetical protein
MKWIRPEEGTVRTVERFLVFPLRINGELRWLEKAKIVQVYEREYIGEGCWVWEWQAVRWGND